MTAGIRLGGEFYDVLHPITQHPIPVFGPEDHGMRFEPGDGYNRARVKDIDLMVWHWTGSENPVETMYRVLLKRELGIEFVITPLGSIFQFCDPLLVDTADTGKGDVAKRSVNARSLGVEMINAGIRRPGTLWMEPRTRKPKLGPRPKYVTTIHGRERTCYGFYPVQTQVALALATTCTKVIPTLPPIVAEGSTVLADVDAFKGHIGHYQISRKKTDPGTQHMEDLRRHFAERFDEAA